MPVRWLRLGRCVHESTKGRLCAAAAFRICAPNHGFANPWKHGVCPKAVHPPDARETSAMACRSPAPATRPLSSRCSTNAALPWGHSRTSVPTRSLRHRIPGGSSPGCITTRIRKRCRCRGALMRRLSIFVAGMLVLGVFPAIASGVIAKAETTSGTPEWDNTYGQSGDQSSFSAIRAAAEAGDGGLYLLGWFWGDFEGLSRPSAYGSFLMKVDAAGDREWIWEFDLPGDGPDGLAFSVAVAPEGELWMTPGPETGGLARVADGKSIGEKGGMRNIVASTSNLILLSSDSNEYGTSDPFYAMDYDGTELWSWNIRDAVEAKGTQVASTGETAVVADDRGIFVAGAWTPERPYAEGDAGVWALGMSGETLWDTVVFGARDQVSCGSGRLATLTPSYFLMENCDPGAEWDDGLWEFSRSDGQRIVYPQRGVVLCGDSDVTVAFPGMSDPQRPWYGSCPAGTEKLDMCAVGMGSARWGYASEESLYSSCGTTFLVRWNRGADDWVADVASAPFGHHPDPETDRLWGSLEMSDGSVVLYGQVGHSAAFRTVGSRTPAGTGSHLAAVSYGVLTDVPEAGGVHRLAGDTRFGTAQEISLDRFESADVSTAYLATAENFPDALAGGPLAAQEGAPVLLVTSTALPDETAAALSDLRPAQVIALGGTSVISDDVLQQAVSAATATSSERIFGADRYATAAEIAKRVRPTGTVYLATGTNFPDALAGGAATGGSPIVLTGGSSLPPATRDVLQTLAPDTIVALGGEAAISPEILAAAAQAAGGATTKRLAGSDRFATALEIAATVPDQSTVYITTGLNYPDALAGVSAAVAEAAPILLSAPDALPAEVEDWLDDAATLRRVVILGGPTAVSQDVSDTLAHLIAR